MKEWMQDKLDNLCIIGDGNHSSKYPKQSEMIAYGVPFIRATNLVEGRISSDNILYISEEKHQELKKGHLKTGDVLFTNRGEIGKVAIVDEAFNGANLNSQIAWLRCRKELLPKYLFFFLQSEQMRQHFAQGKSGAALQQFTIRMIKEVVVSYPSISEQKRIVTILDEAFEGIDVAIANTEKNLANACELFESHLNSIFSKESKDWAEEQLGNIATFRNGLNFTKNSKGESIKIVGVKDFQNNFWLQEDQLETAVIDGELKEIDILRKGDILTVRSNGNKELIGRCVLVGDISKKTSHSGFTIRIRIKREDVYLPFLVHFLKSRDLRKQLVESGGGISISSLNQQGLSLIKIRFPSFTDQRRIVENIDEVAIAIQRLETIYQQKLAALNELKQSILQKAFTGQLTADTSHQATKAAEEVIAA